MNARMRHEIVKIMRKKKKKNQPIQDAKLRIHISHTRETQQNKVI